MSFALCPFFQNVFYLLWQEQVVWEPKCFVVYKTRSCVQQTDIASLVLFRCFCHVVERVLKTNLLFLFKRLTRRMF